MALANPRTRPRALAAIKNHKDWFAHQELVKARDVHFKNNPSLGDSAVNNREATRFVSASTPFAGKALDVRVDGTYATALSSDTLQDELQRKCRTTAFGRESITGVEPRRGSRGLASGSYERYECGTRRARVADKTEQNAPTRDTIERRNSCETESHAG